VVDFGRRAWLDTTTARSAAVAATAAGVVLAAVLPDAFLNVGLLQPMTALLAALVIVLALTVRWPRPGLTEIGLLALCIASLWPRLAHLELGAPGALLFIIATYGIGRLSGVGPRSLTWLLLGCGAVMGAIAIMQAVPHLASLVPFHAMHRGLLVGSTRSTGLFDNPNTFGSYEAASVVLAALVGLPVGWRGTRTMRVVSALLFGAIVLCLVGLGLSASRDSVLGLGAGLFVLMLVPGKGFAEKVRSLLPFAIAAGVALLVVLAVSAFSTGPSISGRFDPTTVTTDHNMLDRVHSWRLAVDLIRQHPLLGYGPTIPMGPVDNAYLEWILTGGVLGLVIWLAGLATVVPRAAWPLLAAVLAMGAFSNPFAVGPALAILLISSGVLASQPLSGAGGPAARTGAGAVPTGPGST